MQLKVERFIIWNQATPLRNVNTRTVPVQHFGHKLGEYNVAKFNTYAVIQIINSHAGGMVYPGLPLTRMRQPIHIFFRIVNVGFGILEKTEHVRASLHKGYICRLHNAMLELSSLPAKDVCQALSAASRNSSAVNRWGLRRSMTIDSGSSLVVRCQRIGTTLLMMSFKFILG